MHSWESLMEIHKYSCYKLGSYIASYGKAAFFLDVLRRPTEEGDWLRFFYETQGDEHESKQIYV